jgi:hypothetical protein
VSAAGSRFRADQVDLAQRWQRAGGKAGAEVVEQRLAGGVLDGDHGDAGSGRPDFPRRIAQVLALEAGQAVDLQGEDE